MHLNNVFARHAILLACLFPSLLQAQVVKKDRPNVIVVYADDLGYGDLSAYGATKISTPNVDRLAREGMLFTNAHTTSGTCTPSRYALMTGEYPWRKSGTNILPGDAALIISAENATLPSVFQKAGYKTGAVGKWHLGLGENGKKINWNQPIAKGPDAVGFDYSFIFPATGDRVPTVFIENQEVVGLEASDPIEVSYQQKIGSEPTGKENPELLKLHASPDHGHNNTIVNGIGRIGYMTGGKKARWTDEEIAHVFVDRAENFIEQHSKQPFFLYFSLNDIHVPRMPSTQFKGKSGLGLRGDAILQLDWTVGRILKKLETLGLAKNTLILFSSDNGPVLDDGYDDGAVTQLNGHNPRGPLRGGKSSAFEAGTRVPFLVRWPGIVKPGSRSDALVCQIDLIASFASFFNQKLSQQDAPDSQDLFAVFTGKSAKGREILVEQGGGFSLVKGSWKYIEPSEGPKVQKLTGTETGRDSLPQLYDLKNDIGEKNNLAGMHPEIVKELAAALKKIREDGRSR
ncbi:sulfatase family protein [Dyadobacter sediminis]|uniref:Arylsulfatase n=1 Tax=Dyadobacter sediminis TaxID=1493691 RepID=A0A5R9KBZ6_9BACT|nr:arylsulfatase [Dyadobacter sediminis]TLU92288.1 arylsulfatase [Dyadobacter sediminis]GGB95741.1 arylsulfatase [Dyadobacter sediminis]